jgi:hypothetical protein
VVVQSPFAQGHRENVTPQRCVALLERPSMASLRKFEWEAIAGLIAAVVAIVLHFLHVTDVNVLRVITLVLVALLFLRDLRGEERWRTVENASTLSVRLLEEIKETTNPAEIDLIGPATLRQATVQFAERAQGEVVWFNACPEMFQSKELCDAILRPFLANPSVTGFRLILDKAQREHWHAQVETTIASYQGRGIVMPPTWADLDSGVSFVLAETDAIGGKAEALVSFWGEPFMAVHHDRRIPGYIIHVHEHSELIGRFREVERASRMP